MGVFSSDLPDPKPVKPDPKPPKKSDKDVQKKAEQARRTAQRRGRSQTILTELDDDQEALGKSRSGRKRQSKLGGS